MAAISTDTTHREFSDTIQADNSVTETEAVVNTSLHEPHVLTVPTTPIAASTPIKPPSKTTQDSSAPPMEKTLSTFSHSLSLPLDKPLSKEEENFNTHFIRRKLYTGPNKTTIKCKTRGQPIVLQKVTASRKDTTLAKTPTKRKRAKLVRHLRQAVARPSKDAEDTQLALELKKISPTA
ncbi:hypothetical protein ElyMa_002960900 [Elysia marginata]|uniref:Tantalus-like domain-containing protein n=1 Tax=Elysia marginata TaxID=1093978 RepID=A0AAV4I7H1_9GAST|nr:hypothetical protein ElyMa_002960900 [Elysia marginata]